MNARQRRRLRRATRAYTLIWPIEKSFTIDVDLGGEVVAMTSCPRFPAGSRIEVTHEYGQVFLRHGGFLEQVLSEAVFQRLYGPFRWSKPK